jgi:hypothetical protein
LDRILRGTSRDTDRPVLRPRRWLQRNPSAHRTHMHLPYNGIQWDRLSSPTTPCRPVVQSWLSRAWQTRSRFLRQRAGPFFLQRNCAGPIGRHKKMPRRPEGSRGAPCVLIIFSRIRQLVGSLPVTPWYSTELHAMCLPYDARTSTRKKVTYDQVCHRFSYLITASIISGPLPKKAGKKPDDIFF